MRGSWLVRADWPLRRWSVAIPDDIARLVGVRETSDRVPYPSAGEGHSSLQVLEAFSRGLGRGITHLSRLIILLGLFTAAQRNLSLKRWREGSSYALTWG